MVNAKTGLRAFVCTVLLIIPTSGFTQDNTSPLFTSPADGASTDVPVLSGNGAEKSDGIIENVGGGKNTPSVDAAQPAAPTVQENSDANTAQNAEAPKTSSNQVESTAIGAWLKECLSSISTGPKCQMTQRVLTPNGQQVILVFSMAKRPEDNKFQVQLAVPLGISIPDGIELQVGNDYKSVLPVARCTAQGCIAEGIAADALIDAMGSAPSGNVLVRDSNGNPIAIKFALDGFNDASTSLN